MSYLFYFIIDIIIILLCNIISFYSQKCLCTHFDNAIIIQGTKSEKKRYAEHLVFYRLIPLRTLVKANFARFLTDLLEKLYPLLPCTFKTNDNANLTKYVRMTLDSKHKTDKKQHARKVEKLVF